MGSKGCLFYLDPQNYPIEIYFKVLVLLKFYHHKHYLLVKIKEVRLRLTESAHLSLVRSVNIG